MTSDLILKPDCWGDVISNLRDTAEELNNCAGLAAPQIGHMVRIILVNVRGRTVIMINPEIIERKGKLISQGEGCFSVPGSITKPVRVRRHNKIHVQWEDELGCTNFARFKSFEARLIQHEIDHLDGILIGDKK
jgi:peptide deformylase